MPRKKDKYEQINDYLTRKRIEYWERLATTGELPPTDYHRPPMLPPAKEEKEEAPTPTPNPELLQRVLMRKIKEEKENAHHLAFKFFSLIHQRRLKPPAKKGKVIENIGNIIYLEWNEGELTRTYTSEEPLPDNYDIYLDATGFYHYKNK